MRSSILFLRCWKVGADEEERKEEWNERKTTRNNLLLSSVQICPVHLIRYFWMILWWVPMMGMMMMMIKRWDEIDVSKEKKMKKRNGDVAPLKKETERYGKANFSLFTQNRRGRDMKLSLFSILMLMMFRGMRSSALFDQCFYSDVSLLLFFFYNSSERRPTFQKVVYTV